MTSWIVLSEVSAAVEGVKGAGVVAAAAAAAVMLLRTALQLDVQH